MRTHPYIGCRPPSELRRWPAEGNRLMMNTMRTGLLMAGLTGLFLAAGFLAGGEPGMLIAFVFAAGSNLFAYWNSDKVLLSMYGAQPVDETSAPEMVHLGEQLSRKAGLPT